MSGQEQALEAECDNHVGFCPLYQQQCSSCERQHCRFNLAVTLTCVLILHDTYIICRQHLVGMPHVVLFDMSLDVRSKQLQTMTKVAPATAEGKSITYSQELGERKELCVSKYTQQQPHVHTRACTHARTTTHLTHSTLGTSPMM